MTMPNAPVDQGNQGATLTPVSMPATDYVHVNDFRRLQSSLDRQIAAANARAEMLQGALLQRDDELSTLRRTVEELSDSLLPDEERQKAQVGRLRTELETLRKRPVALPMPDPEPRPRERSPQEIAAAKSQFIGEQLAAFGLSGQEPGLSVELARAQNREQAVAAMARAQGRMETARNAQPGSYPGAATAVPQQPSNAGQVYLNAQGQYVDAQNRPVNADGTPAIYAPGQGAPAFMQPHSAPRIDTGGPAPVGAQPAFTRDAIQQMAKSRQGAAKLRELRDRMAQNNPAVQTS